MDASNRPSQPLPTSYAFGDSDIAARRLHLLSEVFAESSRAFLLETLTRRPELAVDLGSGPGNSTHFLANTAQSLDTVGLDNSEHFIFLAKKTETKNVRFYLHDVTSVPFPVPPGDLLYCRFLLTHLKNPQQDVGNWASQLRSAGLLLMEELEWIDTTNSVFASYLKIVESMLVSQSNTLYVGKVLNELQIGEPLQRRLTQIATLPVDTRRAASMFFLNIQSWRAHPFVKGNYPPVVINELQDDLRGLMEQSPGKKEIVWSLRQLVFQRG